MDRFQISFEIRLHGNGVSYKGSPSYLLADFNLCPSSEKSEKELKKAYAALKAEINEMEETRRRGTTGQFIRLDSIPVDIKVVFSKVDADDALELDVHTKTTLDIAANVIQAMRHTMPPEDRLPPLKVMKLVIDYSDVEVPSDLFKACTEPEKRNRLILSFFRKSSRTIAKSMYNLWPEDNTEILQKVAIEVDVGEKEGKFKLDMPFKDDTIRQPSGCTII